MTLNFFGSLAKLLGGRSKAKYRSDLLKWAKAEYANDWEFAYNYMLNNGGKAPDTYTRGITL